MRYVKLFISVIVLSIPSIAQETVAVWEPIYNESKDMVFIDITGVEIFSGEDLYVWSLTKHFNPIVIESIDGKIYSTNTYYLFNTRINRYSMIYIIYYDKNTNVLASFDYGRKSDIEAYQYNYPIWKNSLEKRILERCIEVINSKKVN
jgi:hypothetical protein